MMITDLMLFLNLQNEYIKYPVLDELSHKYLADNPLESSLQDRLEEIKDVIKKEIRKELKVSEFLTINDKRTFINC